MPESDSETVHIISGRLRTVAADLLGDRNDASIQVTIGRNGQEALAVIESSAAEQLAQSRNLFENASADLSPARALRIIFTSHSQSQQSTPHRRTARQPRPPEQSARPRPEPPDNTPPIQTPPTHTIDRIIAVVSAKGGVGKSTVAVNMAVAAARSGLRTGLLDADIHGPSIPTMLGTADKSHEAVNENNRKKLIPISAHGISTVSMGHIAGRDQAVVWRGPMVSSALWQMFDEVEWGELDLMIVDTPPGTGDALLTLVQKISPTGVVIVTTPQEVALADVARGQQAFAKTDTPVLGVIENMSFYDLPSGERVYMFGRGGGQRAADAFGVPLLASIPVDSAIGISCDQGLPIVLSDNHSDALYRALVQTIRKRAAPDS